MAEVCDALQVSLSVAEALECVVQRCVGPSGGSVIFSKDTGQTLITKHGHSILTALQLEHPVARMVLECLHFHNGVTADGSKSFILLLSALLRGICDSMHNSSRAHQRHASWKLANQIHALCWGGLDDVIAHGIIPYTSSLFGPSRGELDGGLLAALVGGYLGGHVSSSKAELLNPLLCEFYMRVGQGDLDGASISFISSNFSKLHVAVTGLHSAQSRVVEGLLLSCDWSVWAKTDGQVTVLAVFERLDARYDESACVQFKENWTIWSDSILQNRLAAIQRLKVNVMISAVKQPDHVLEWAGLNTVSVLNCCDPAQLELLCELNEAQIITTQPLARVGMLTHCRRFQIGGRRYAHVGLRHPSLHTHTLVLCSPTEGALQQSVSASRGVCTLLQHLIQSHRVHSTSLSSQIHTVHQSSTSPAPCPNLLQCILNSGDVIPVGGAFEILLHHSLLYSTHGDYESRRLLAQAALNVPRSLHAHRPKDFLQHFVSFRKHLLQHHPTREQGSRSKFMWGLAASRHVEPVCSKKQLVVSVMQCVNRILRVEMVLHPARSLPPPATPAEYDSGEVEDDEEKEGLETM